MKRTALAMAIGAISIGLSGAVLAQENSQNDTENANQMTQQDVEGNEQSTNNETRDITVDQEPAEIEVEQESPDITVDQAQPEVTITQPEPEVTVEEAEPNVTVEQTGETEVTVEQAEDAQVDVNEEEQDRQQSDQADQNNQENSLMSHQVSDLEGMTVINLEDEEIGDVKHIAKHDNSGELFAIVSVGGLWGIGATDIALSVNEMQLQNDQLVVSTDYGEDEIEDSSSDYQEDEYSEVDSDMTLSEAQQQ